MGPPHSGGMPMRPEEILSGLLLWWDEHSSGSPAWMIWGACMVVLVAFPFACGICADRALT